MKLYHSLCNACRENFKEFSRYIKQKSFWCPLNETTRLATVCYSLIVIIILSSSSSLYFLAKVFHHRYVTQETMSVRRRKPAMEFKFNHLPANFLHSYLQVARRQHIFFLFNRQNQISNSVFISYTFRSMFHSRLS